MVRAKGRMHSHSPCLRRGHLALMWAAALQLAHHSLIRSWCTLQIIVCIRRRKETCPAQADAQMGRFAGHPWNPSLYLIVLSRKSVCACLLCQLIRMPFAACKAMSEFPDCLIRQAIANHFALASGRKKPEGCHASSLGSSLHESGDCLCCLTHVQNDLQQKARSKLSSRRSHA